MPVPYIPASPNELIRAVDWNNLQIQARTEIQGHGHTGSDDGTPIGTGGIADLAIDQAKLADAAVTTAKILDGSVTLAKLAPDAIGAGSISEPAALDVTGSTVDAVPLAPHFDHFSIQQGHTLAAVLPPFATQDDLEIQTPLGNVVDTFVGSLGGAGVTEPFGRAAARALALMIDTLPRPLIEHLGSAEATHNSVLESMPAYGAQLQSLSEQVGGDVMAPAIAVMEAIDSIPTAVIRTFAYAFAADLEALFGPGGEADVLGQLAAFPTMGEFYRQLSPQSHLLLSGRMVPIVDAPTLRITPAAQLSGGGALMLCEAQISVDFTNDNGACVVGIGTETTPPPPAQVTYIARRSAGGLADRLGSGFVRRSMFFLPGEEPALNRSVRLWGSSFGAVGLTTPQDVVSARIDCRHVLLRPYGQPQIVAASDATAWNDGPDAGG